MLSSSTQNGIEPLICSQFFWVGRFAKCFFVCEYKFIVEFGKLYIFAN